MLDLLPANIKTPSLEATELEDLLKYLKRVSQVDLTGYKRSSLLRRTQVRMQRTGVSNYREYFAHLRQQPDEVTHLLDTIFINYTYFFRDHLVWDCLKTQVIPQILANKSPNEPIRVWSAGCASGEEAYSLAILFAELLGLEQFQRRVRIYGTDVDRDAVLQAQRGCYPRHVAEGIPSDLLERYFENTVYGYRWRQKRGQSIRFYTHNLMQSSSLPCIDLLVCRNAIMYFTLEAQLRTLRHLHSSLNRDGFLLLGKAEGLVTRSQTALFAPAYQQMKVFKKVGISKQRPREIDKRSVVTWNGCQESLDLATTQEKLPQSSRLATTLGPLTRIAG